MSWFSHKKQPVYDWAQASREHGTLENAVSVASADDSAATYHHMHQTSSQEYYCGNCSKMMPLSSFPHPH